MSNKLFGWQTGLSFALGASVSFLVSFLTLRRREDGSITIPRRVKSKREPVTEDTIVPRNETMHVNDDGDFREAMVVLNESAMGEFQRQLQTVPWADLGTLYTRWARIYSSSKHRLMQKRSLKSQDCRGSAREARIYKELISVSQNQPEIRFPLAPEVMSLLQQHSEQRCELDGDGICSALSSALKAGTAVWSHFARAVIQIDDHIVVKVGSNITLTDANITDHIQRHTSDIPVPRPLGVLSIGSMTYAFMTLIEGCPLDKVWPDLSSVEKSSIRDQLSVIIKKLRLLPLPSQYLGGGSPPQCIDCRMWKRESPKMMETEAQFNDFLLSGNKRPGMEPYVEFVRPMFREDHKIVLTHGDLHPRNIMVTKNAGGAVQVTGLIDWEVGGAYPEYWEFIKSLNTIRPIRSGDWPFFLPVEGMGRYCEEYAIDCLADNCVT
ncbi:hypothetical protein MauCBS54593_006597 [Microsporum audouinii]